MAFKTFAPGVLTSSDVNTFLMRQAVITCTSSTRPASPSEGMTIYETDTDLFRTYSGSAWENGYKSGAWVSYSPTVLNASTGTDWILGNGTITGYYQRVGRLVHGIIVCVWGSTSVFGTKDLGFSAPFQALDSVVNGVVCGQAVYYDDSIGVATPGFILRTFTANSSFLRPFVFTTPGTYVKGADVNQGVPFTWAQDDVISLSFTYEAAAA